MKLFISVRLQNDWRKPEQLDEKEVVHRYNWKALDVDKFYSASHQQKSFQSVKVSPIFGPFNKNQSQVFVKSQPRPIAIAPVEEDMLVPLYVPTEAELPSSMVQPRTGVLAGLENIGSTCYYNAIMQALFATDL